MTQFSNQISDLDLIRIDLRLFQLPNFKVHFDKYIVFGLGICLALD